MQNLVNVQGEIKAVASSCTGTPTAKLIALLEAAGITKATEVAAILGISDRAVRKAKAELQDRNHSSAGTTVPELQDRGEPQFRNSSSENGTTVPNSPSRVLDNNKLTSLADSSVSEVKKDSCAVLPLPNNPRAKGTNPRQAGSSDELGVKFEQFWSIFPAGRKRAKGKCRSIFVQIARGGHYMLKASADEMIDAARRYAATKPDSKYVPMPLTWLNQGRWEDDAGQAEAAAVTAKVEYFKPAWYDEARREMAAMGYGQ